MKAKLFALMIPALFLGSPSCSTFAEKTYSTTSDEIILGELYVGSIYIAQESTLELDVSSSDNSAVDKPKLDNVSISETREITVSGASLSSCQAALLEVLKKSKNVVSRSDCKVKDREDLTMIMMSVVNPKNIVLALD